ncbi:SGNH/GDSL hydrolase family protein [Thermaurantiacus tibetensis]|uniref:SGNH/GDSL hydrolase family protein n=1 Tax=Thermaurantiacus tibetensis TaxID=2759035 RepID=UPI00189084C6|nr:SGNH/GDSL hydrolase family protein [Thermaurantiacus tibetensis]
MVGTSLTARGDWPFQLGEALAACRGGPVVVERLARPGATSAWGRDALAARLAAPGPPPTLALIEFTVNDARLHAGVPLARSRAHAGKMTALVRGRGGLPVLVTMSPVHGLALLRRPAVAAYRRAWAGVAAAAGAGHVDTVPAFAVAERRELREAIPDGIHPTDAAMRARLVPALTAVLEPLVRLSPGTAASQLPLPSRRH